MVLIYTGTIATTEWRIAMNQRAFYRMAEKTKPVPAESSKNMDFLWGVKIPMRDGIHLNATVYKPKGKKKVPAIFTLTPYIADSYHPRASYFSQNGYGFVLVDCRGRGNSEGKFLPFISEAQDGHDVVEWLAKQSWCDGQVTMWGGSYGGFNQWMTLKEFPKHLKTIVPAASVHAGVDFPFFNNIFLSYDMQWPTFTSGVTGNSTLFGDSSFWIEKFQEMYQNHVPYKDLDRIVGNASTVFHTWIEHPLQDAYWDELALTRSQYERINIPILTITGHYDADQPGAMAYYRNHMASKSRARENHYLVIGPWDHPGTRTPKVEFGGLKFGEASVIDLNKLHKEWYDWIMKKGKKPVFLKKRVAYYVMGAEKWKYADSLEKITRKHKRFYLNSNGNAKDAFHSGSMNAKPAKESRTDSYAYDPLDKRPAELEREEIQDYYTDQTYDLNLFGNGLVYHTEPFARDTEITGWIKFVAWISLDVPDTDFNVRVSEVLQNGQVISLTQDLMRARYRNSLRQEELVTPGEIIQYVFKDFTFFSRRIARGSRLRLVICSPNSILVEKNYNSGGVVAEESAKDARVAHISLYHNNEFPSYLEVPLGR
jgi:putative CocE/NonD family hydrolase